jgi:hypothetical protein
MYQQQIEFFWPLTEQIPLDLDYKRCDNRNLYTTVTTSMSIPRGLNLSTEIPWTTSFRLQENTTTIIVQKEPNFIRKIIYKLIGFKWEVN